MAALSVSLALGLWADQAAEVRHWHRWVAGEGPSLRVWRRALEAEGFGELDHEQAHRKVIRTLPSLVEPPGSVWLSSDGKWLAIYPREENESPRIFGEGLLLKEIKSGLTAVKTGKPLRSVPAPVGKRLPDAWRPLGEGWPVLEEALILAARESGEARRRVVPARHPRPVRRGVLRDPREIRF